MIQITLGQAAINIINLPENAKGIVATDPHTQIQVLIPIDAESVRLLVAALGTGLVVAHGPMPPPTRTN